MTLNQWEHERLGKFKTLIQTSKMAYNSEHTMA